MSESTVLNEESNDSVSSIASSSQTRSETPVIPEPTVEPTAIIANTEDEEIMSHLLAHENSTKKPRLDNDLGMAHKPTKEDSSSDSEGAPSPKQKSKENTTGSSAVTEVADVIESDEEDHEVMVKVGDKQYPLNAVSYTHLTLPTKA